MRYFSGLFWLAALAVVGASAPVPTRSEVRAHGLRPTSISVGWDAAGRNVAAYEVIRDGKTIATVSDTKVLSFVDADLVPASRHLYEIRAITQTGQAFSLGGALAKTSIICQQSMWFAINVILLGVNAYLCCQTGGRFCMKELSPSLASAVGISSCK